MAVVTHGRSVLAEPQRQPVAITHDFVRGHAQAGKLFHLLGDCGDVYVVAWAELVTSHVKQEVRMHDLVAHRGIATCQIVEHVPSDQRDKRGGASHDVVTSIAPTLQRHWW